MKILRIIVLFVLAGGAIAGGVAAYPRIRNYFVILSMATLGAPHTVELSWDVAPAITSYNIYRSSFRNTGYRKIGATAGPPFFDFPVPASTTYYYAVTAVNPKGESGYSDRVRISLP